MADVVSPQKRSEMMSGIKAKDTKPEIFVRKALFRKGYRYRIHNKSLPGKPDIVLAKYKVAIQINGCYWHGHEDCPLFRLPKSKTEFWDKKIKSNITRDERSLDLLAKRGWRVVIVWECAIKGKDRIDPANLLSQIESFIKSKNRTFLSIRGIPQDTLCATSQ